MINVQIPRTIGSPASQVQVWRPTSQTFWLMVVLQGLLVAGVMLFVLSRVPSSIPLAHTDGALQVRDFVLAGNHAADSLIEVTPGVFGRSSNVRGLRVDGQTYYYYFEGRAAYDPLNQGIVMPNQVEVVLRDTNEETALVIYRVVDQ